MQTIERMILIALMRDMRAKGYEVAAVWDGSQYCMAVPKGEVEYFDDGDPPTAGDIVRPLTDAEALHAIDAVCESTLHFTHRDKKTWGNRGVLVILGNGKDVLSDFHAPDNEPFCGVVTIIYDKLEEGAAL